VARYQIPVGTVVLLGSLVGALAAVMAVVHDRARRRRTLRTDEELTARRLHALIVPVVSLDDSDGSQLIEIPDFPHLAELAQFLQRPILYALRDDRATYAVDDETVRYRYRPGGQSSPGHPASNRGHKPPGPGHGRRWSLPAKGGAALFVVGALITVSSVFTLSTTVPSSYAGTSNQALQISQLAPVGCSSLALTSLVQGSGVFSNTVSKALVLGSAGADTITDSGTGNCIVGGGGTNTITGTASDICISGPTLAVAAPCPTATPTTTTTTTRPVNPSNGLTATPASDNYNNYGGQERLTLTNTYAITAMTVTINVAQTAGVNFNSQSNSFPGGALTQTSTVAGGVITYSWVLAAGTTIPAGYNGVLYAQFGGSGSAHAMSGDTWTVTSTSNGISSNLTGTF